MNQIEVIAKRYEAVENQALNLIEKLTPENKLYHNKDHTKRVRDVFIELALAEGITPLMEEFYMGKTGAILHDIGQLPFIAHKYPGKPHEEAGAEFAEVLLTSYGYLYNQIRTVQGIILATKIPQNPQNFLEQAVCDADVWNFGGEEFWKQNELVRKELELTTGVSKTDKEWYAGNLSFLQGHHYHTDTAKRLRDKKKAENMEELKRRAA